MEKHNWVRNAFVGKANATQKLTSLESQLFYYLSCNFPLKSMYSGVQ